MRQLRFPLERHSVLKWAKQLLRHLTPGLGILKVACVALRTFQHCGPQILRLVQEVRNGREVLMISRMAWNLHGLNGSSTLRASIDGLADIICLGACSNED